MKIQLSNYSKFAFGVLAYTIFVILFGAFVRATGSGAGCGAHWPLCNGVIIPRPERIETVIEFTHRVTSGLTIPFMIGLFIWTWRLYPQRSPMRVSSAMAMFFIITESLVGAGLVLFELVAHNDSIARAFWMMAHLINTFLLLGSITITAWWAASGVPEKHRLRGLTGILLVVGAAGILILGASGAVTALGDTLFPSETLAEGLAQDFLPTAHWLERMRIFHPGIAISVGVYLFLVTTWVRKSVNEPRIEAATNTLYLLYVLQIFIGIFNVGLLAPVWIQIIHLLVSNLIWIVFLVMSALVFRAPILLGAADSAVRLSDHPIHERIHDTKSVG